MKYTFATNINNSGESGIIDIETLKVICICPETNSELILQALNMHNRQRIEMPSKTEANKYLEELLQEKYPVFSQIDAEKHHDRRHSFAYGFELAIEWLKSLQQENQTED